MPEARAARARLDPAAEGAARHGIAAPRGQRPPSGPRGGRFGRMFPFLPQRDPGEKPILALVEHMALQESSQTDIPAGYTYLGQFIDHDITFDPTSKLQRDNDPQALVNFRTPRFDLDSLYGAGRADQPFLYDWDQTRHPGVKLLVDRPRDKRLAEVDLPRNSQGRALIGDGRNDENLIISQLHLLFVRFHNAVVDHLCDGPGELGGAELFDEAQRLVRWHYQWIVTHDFLRRVVGKTTASSILHEKKGDVPTVKLRHFTWRREPVIPVEFSGAAFRFGHSMVRPSYRLNDDVVAEVFPFPGQSGPDLSGFRRLPRPLVIAWENFFFDRFVDGRNRSMKIDTGLAKPLSHLPRETTEDGPSLAWLNLTRGRALGLPAGQDVANAMGIERLDDDDLLSAQATPEPVPGEAREALLAATPLWYYILCEAAKRGERWGGEPGGGKHLGPVGGRIVGEVLVGLLAADPHSYLRQFPTWRPHLHASREDFTMTDLVRFAEQAA